MTTSLRRRVTSTGSKWSDLAVAEFNARPGVTADKVVPLIQKGSFIEAMLACWPYVPPVEDCTDSGRAVPGVGLVDLGRVVHGKLPCS